MEWYNSAGNTGNIGNFFLNEKEKDDKNKKVYKPISLRRYFITGGGGFIGRAIVRNLLQKDDTEHIACLTRTERHNRIIDPRVHYIKGDVINVDYGRNIGAYTDLIHAAAEANDLLYPDQPQYYMTVVEGARRIFEWAADGKFERVLFVSSGGVVKTDSPYCRAKRMSEWLAERYQLKAKIVRVYSVVGEEMPLNGQYALGRFIWQAIFDKEVRYYGGASVRSYIHVDEAAEQIIGVLNDFNGLAPIDIGSSVSISISELANMVSTLYGVPCKQIEATYDHRPANIYVPSNGYIPKITLEESLRRVREYIRG